MARIENTIIAIFADDNSKSRNQAVGEKEEASEYVQSTRMKLLTRLKYGR